MFWIKTISDYINRTADGLGVDPEADMARASPR
jgi:hypothetical protein